MSMSRYTLPIRSGRYPSQASTMVSVPASRTRTQGVRVNARARSMSRCSVASSST